MILSSGFEIVFALKWDRKGEMVSPIRYPNFYQVILSKVEINNIKFPSPDDNVRVTIFTVK